MYNNKYLQDLQNTYNIVDVEAIMDLSVEASLCAMSITRITIIRDNISKKQETDNGQNN